MFVFVFNLSKVTTLIRTPLRGHLRCVSNMKAPKPVDCLNSTASEMIKVLTDSGKCQELREANKWYKRSLEYNTLDGKKTRGISLITSFKTLASEQQLKDDNLSKASHVLGYCLELIQAYFLVHDDLIDHSVSRRGQPCWYQLEDVGLSAVLDGCYIRSAAFELIKRYVKDVPCYVEILELFMDTDFKTLIGQHLDTSLAKQPLDLNKFTHETYLNIVTYKTAYYTMSAPVRTAMYLTGNKDLVQHMRAESVLKKIGVLFQVQDDILDCFGDPKITGKVGTDIQDGKCSWLIVTALESANESVKNRLKEIYGKDDDDSVQEVKTIYKELQIEEKFKKFEEEQKLMIMKEIEQLSKETNLPSSLFLDVLYTHYKRIM